MENNHLSPITHAEARRLINFNSDQVLDVGSYSILNAHLNACVECRSYASELDEVENILRTLKQKWNQHPAPLHIVQIKSQNKNVSFGLAKNLTMTSMTMMVLAVIVMSIGIWQFSILNSALPATPLMAIPIPTPSTYLTSAKATILNCDYVPYQVQANDTLDNIALQFSVPKETIMDLNGMKEEKIEPGTQLSIPLCNHTPTVTINAPNTTITISPQFEPITLTPG